MKQTTRLTLIALLALLVLVCGTVLVACGGNAEEAINAYMLNVDTVEDDFVLPKHIGELDKNGVGKVQVKWTSDNEAIEIVEREDDFLAKVNQQSKLVGVNLTISAKKYEKTFKVNVFGFNVYSLSGSYVFMQERATVGSDFELDTSWTYKGKTATITWSVTDAESAKYLNVVKDGDKAMCVVTVPDGDPVAVQINATFEYAGETTTKPFDLNVGEEKEHLDYVDTIYTVQNYSLKFSGYVVAIHEVSTGNGNATFYAIDDDFCSGYYFYRIKLSAADLAKFALGVHVTITGDTTKDYNGLWENAGGGTAVIDDAPEGIPATINPRDHVYALDNDIIAGSPATLYHESTLVSLTGWTIVEKYKSAPEAGKTGTLFYVQKAGSAKVAVTITRYMEGHYKTQAGDATWEALCAYYTSLEIGDVINVTGILGNYNGFQIQPLTAEDISKTTADPEGTTYLGTAVKTAIKDVNDAITAAKIDNSLAEAHNFTLPTKSGDVTIAYKICGESKAVKLETTTDGAKFSVTPGSNKEARKIQVTYTNGTYVTYTFFTITSQKLSDAGIVENVKNNLDNEIQKGFLIDSEVTLPTSAQGYSDVTITWEITNGGGAWATLDNGKLTIALDSEEHSVTLTATIKLGSVTDTKEITLKLSAKAFEVLTGETPADGTYKLAMFQANLNKWLYMTGAMAQQYYFGTTEKAAEAVDIKLAAVTDGWTLQISGGDNDGKYLRMYPRDATNSSSSLQFSDSAENSVWKWNAELNAFYVVIGSDNYYLGTSGTYNTFSGSKESNYTSGTNFLAHLGTLPTNA